jgi:hypothetical protein
MLSEEQQQHFLEKGYVLLHDCFGKEQVEFLLQNVWARLDMDPQDKATWTRERTNMPWHRKVEPRTFSPKAWQGICDIVGGEARIDLQHSRWSDAIIVNLGESNGQWVEPYKLNGFHSDGDNFYHYLDSPEMTLLVFPVLSDEILPKGGATIIAPESIKLLAEKLASHPEGINPKDLNIPALVPQCTEFIELTGKLGDVYLVHPFMVHSASKNILRIPRYIIAPKVWLKEPLKFDRDPKDLSLLEKSILRALGKTSFDYQVQQPRITSWKPRREFEWDEKRKQEMRRISLSQNS